MYYISDYSLMLKYALSLLIKETIWLILGLIRASYNEFLPQRLLKISGLRNLARVHKKLVFVILAKSLLSRISGSFANDILSLFT